MEHNPLRNVLLSILCVGAPSCASGPSPRHLPAEGAIGPYSAAVEAGDLVFVSGKIGKPGGTLGENVKTAIDSIEADLDRVGLRLSDVVSVTVFLTDMAGYAEMNAAYAERFPQPYPARTTVGVSALPAGARVEIQAVAARGRR